MITDTLPLVLSEPEKENVEFPFSVSVTLRRGDRYNVAKQKEKRVGRKKHIWPALPFIRLVS